MWYVSFFLLTCFYSSWLCKSPIATQSYLFKYCHFLIGLQWQHGCKADVYMRGFIYKHLYSILFVYVSALISIPHGTDHYENPHICFSFTFPLTIQVFAFPYKILNLLFNFQKNPIILIEFALNIVLTRRELQYLILSFQNMVHCSIYYVFDFLSTV